MIFKSRG